MPFQVPIKDSCARAIPTSRTNEINRKKQTNFDTRIYSLFTKKGSNKKEHLIEKTVTLKINL